MLNLEWYRTFRAIYDTGTLTAAAERIFISQPGASLHLSSLESYVGDKLFDRVNKRMVPTEKGKALYNMIAPHLDVLEEIEQSFHRTADAQRPTLTLGMCYETFQLMMEPLIHQLPCNLVNRFSDYPKLLDDLEKGYADAIVTPHTKENKELVFTPLFEEHIIVVGSQSIDKAAMLEYIDSHSVKEVCAHLSQYNWYGSSTDNEHFLRFWQANFGQRPSFQPNYVVPNFRSIIKCLCYGEGVAIVPDFLAAEQLASGELQVLWEGYVPVSNVIYFGHRKKAVHLEEVKVIEGLLCERIGR